MLVDVVTWHAFADGCHRCQRVADHYVTPYWRPADRVCPLCCSELNRLYDEIGWPPSSLE